MPIPESSDLLLFLAIMREGNMVSAGRRLGIDHSTVARRLSGLERSLGVKLFTRTPKGSDPTSAAFALKPHAERIESELNAATASVAEGDHVVDGAVRLATTEMFGTHLVAPHLGRLRTRHPDLLLELATGSRANSLAKREADLAVMLAMPPRGRLLARKLADYRLALYASREYLSQHAAPRCRDDLQSHNFVSYIEDLVGFPELITLDQILAGANIVFRSSSATAQQAAVAGGMGMGILHMFAAAHDDRLVRLLPDEIEVWRSFWLVMPDDLQRQPRVRATVQFLEECVSTMRDWL